MRFLRSAIISFAVILAPFSFAEDLEEMLSESTSIFSCSVQPLNVEIFKYKEEQDTAIAVVKLGEDYKASVVKALWEIRGSGVCRHSIWTFDFDGKMSVKTPGCYGEILPPEDWEVKGELLLHDPWHRWFFCN